MTDGPASEGAHDPEADDTAPDRSETDDAAPDHPEVDDATDETPPATEGSASATDETATDRPSDAAADEGASGQETADEGASGQETADEGATETDLPPDVRKYDRFKKIDGGTYDRANEFLRDRTYVTAREWAIARLCADFRTETGVEMTKIGENLPELVPFMTDTYTPQAVNQARASFEEKVRKAGATFLYGAMCDFFTAEELDDVMYEATEVAKFLLEVEGVELTVEEELEAEDEISGVMREVREQSAALRHDEIECPDCGHHFEATAADAVDDD